MTAKFGQQPSVRCNITKLIIQIIANFHELIYLPLQISTPYTTEVNSNGIIIGNPQLSQFSITQQGVRWIYHSITGDLPREEITLSGFIGGVSATAIRGIWNGTRNHPGITITKSYTVEKMLSTILSTQPTHSKVESLTSQPI